MKKNIKQKITVKGHYRFTLKNIYTGKERVYEYDNVITNVFLGKIAELITTPSGSNSLLVNYCAVGTGTNVPSASDIKLQTELARTLNASASYSGKVAYITGFFSQSECNGTLKEAGVFIGGTATADSGLLVSRVAINIVKTSSDTFTMDWTLTIS